MRRLLASLALVVFLCIGLSFSPPPAPVTHYVDTNADAGGDGTTSATTGAHCAWDTIADVNAATFAAGDSVLFNKGCTWREQLTVPSSGSAGSVITFGAYGTGDDPIICGADLKTDPTDWMGYEHSDDFETGDTSKWDQENVAGTSTIAVAAAAKYAGTYGLRSTSDGTNMTANVQVDLAAASSDITVEFYVRLNATFDEAATYQQCSIFMFSSGASYRAAVMIRQAADGVFHVIGENVGPWSRIESSAISLNTWYKVKYRYLVNATTGGHQLWLDSLGGSGYVNCGSVFTLDTSGDTISRIYLGITNYNTTTITNGSYVDLDGEVITVGDTVNKLAYKSVAVTGADLTTCMQDGIGLTRNSTSIASLAAGEFFVDASDYIWVAPTGGGSPASYQTAIPTRNSCIEITDKDYITIEDLSLLGGLYYGIFLDDGPLNTTIDGVTIKYNGIVGIQGNNGGDHTTNLVVNNCELAYNYRHGLSVIDDADTVTVTNNSVHHNAFDGEAQSTGIYIKSENADRITNVTITGNESYGNGIGTTGDGIYVDTVEGSTCLIAYNSVHDNKMAGISIEYQDATQCYYNLAYDNWKGIAVFRQASSNLIYNNVTYSNGIGLDLTDSGEGNTDANVFKNNISTGNSNYAIEENAGASNTVYLNNCLGAEAAAFLSWNGTEYSTYDAWEAALGGTTTSVESDPLMTDPASDDFTLQVGSPCINAGTNVSLTEDYAGTRVPQGPKPDIGAYERLRRAFILFLDRSLTWQ